MTAVNTDHSKALVAELNSVTSLEQFCQGWTSKWRGYAVAAQGILSVFFPPASTVIGYLISIADTFCVAKPTP